eukprot:2713030-Lingulodinium_polyedra.AAC.1
MASTPRVVAPYFHLAYAMQQQCVFTELNVVHWFGGDRVEECARFCRRALFRGKDPIFGVVFRAMVFEQMKKSRT